MKIEEKRVRVEPKQAQPAQRLTDEDLSQAAGGAGYTSIRCKKCGKEFADLDEYRKHIEKGHRV